MNKIKELVDLVLGCMYYILVIVVVLLLCAGLLFVVFELLSFVS